MLRLVALGAWRRRRRSAVLVLALALAACAFTVLVNNASSARLELRGGVRGAQRGAYDLLIRPAPGPGGLLAPNFTAGQVGGISLAQYRTIAGLPGVDVAAPVALLGQVTQHVDVVLDVTDLLTAARPQVVVADVTHRSDRGLSRFVTPAATYSYVTDRPLQVLGAGDGQRDADAAVTTVEHQPDGRRLPVCTLPAPSTPAAAAAIALAHLGRCWSTAAGSPAPVRLPRGHVGLVVPWSFPAVLAAVDPAAEQRLDGLAGAVTQGRYLPLTAPSDPTAIPVLVADQTYDDRSETLALRRLPDAAAQQLAGANGDRLAGLLAAGGPVLATRTVTSSDAYRALLAAEPPGTVTAALGSYVSAGPVRYRTRADGALEVVPRSAADDDPALGALPVGPDAAPAAVDGTDTAVRDLTAHVGAPGPVGTPRLQVVGTFSQARAAATMTTSVLPLEVYRVAPLVGADAASSVRLGGQPLLPDANPAGYLTAPPVLLTSLSALGQLTDPARFTAPSPRPISVVRVRVAGVQGADSLSLERIRAVADLIHSRTGLDVSVLLGATAVNRTVVLPPGAHGRPPLALTETWVRPAVTTSLVRRLDGPSLALFALVLGACGLFVANNTIATLRSRRAELATVNLLGWSRRRIVAAGLLEPAVLGLLAGAVGALAAAPFGAALHLPLDLPRALWSIPVAGALAVLAGAGPVLRAARAESLRTGHQPAAPRPIRSAATGVTGTALKNLARAPVRNLLAALAVALGSAALTALLAVRLAFGGSLTGTLAGRIVSIQPHGADAVAVGGILVLGAALVVDLLRLGMLERRPVLGLLWLLGWDEQQLRRLMYTEILLVTAAGALTGAAVGGVGVAVVAGTAPAAVWTAATVGALGTALVVAVPARGALTALSRRRPPDPLVADR